MSKDILGSLMLVLANAVIAGFGFCVNRAIGYFKTKHSNVALNGVLERVSTLSLTVVKDVFQSYVGSLKASQSFDGAAQQAAKNMALESVKKYIGPEGLSQLMKALGSDTAVQAFISSAIEAALVDFKAQQTKVAHAPVTMQVVASAPVPVAPEAHPV